MTIMSYSSTPLTLQQLSALPTTHVRALLLEKQKCIRALHDQLSAAEQEFNMIKTVLSPFTRLPQELISEIFFFYCASQGMVYDEFQKRASRTRPSKTEPNLIVSGINTIPPQLILTQISKLWRDIAHQTRPLWIDLTMYIQTGKFPHQSELIEQWLHRSGQHSVDIHIFIPKGKGQTTKSLLDVFIPFSARWRRIELSAPLQTLRPFLNDSACFDAPLLEHVRMDVCHITDTTYDAYNAAHSFANIKHGRLRTFDAAPQLRSFVCSVSAGDYGTAGIPHFAEIIPPHINELAIQGFAYDGRGIAFIRIWGSSLVSCSVEVPYGFDEKLDSLTLPNLRTLSIAGDGPFEIASFLRHLTTPSLTRLKIASHRPGIHFDPDPDTYQQLLDMQKRSSFALEELQIYNSANHGDKFLEFLVSSSSIKRLTIADTIPMWIQPLIPWFAYHRGPRQVEPVGALLDLTELRLHFCRADKLKKVEAWKDYPLTGLVNIVRERGSFPNLVGVGRTLRALEVQMEQKHFEGLKQEQLAELEKYSKLGLKICLKICQADGNIRYVGDKDIASK